MTPEDRAELERWRHLGETEQVVIGSATGRTLLDACNAIEALDREAAEQATRLKAAEDLCVMYSWSPARHITDRDKAAHELWRRWYGIVGSDFLKAEAHPDLSDEMVALLAAQRDETRARTIARIRPDGNAELPGGEG